MKILFVFTGGTIGSTLGLGNVISPDPQKSYKIIDAYAERYEIDFDYDVIEPYIELSENNTGLHIKMLVSCIKENLDKGYDGIIVTHGSDTLQYSASAIGYCVGLESLPICIVAANSPVEDLNSNAIDNLQGAISFIKQKLGKGAFVVYRNSCSREVEVHRSTRLIASKAYSDEVMSLYGINYGYFDKEFAFEKNIDYCECADEAEVLSVLSLQEQSSDILVVNAYPGMIYPQLSEKIKYVVLNTYHSGTLNTKSQSARDFFCEAREKNVTVYATGISDGAQYSSAKAFNELCIVPMKNLSPISVYVKLWLLNSIEKDVTELMQKSICGDVFQ